MIRHDLRQVSRSDDLSRLEELVNNIVDCGGLGRSRDLGALKLFDIPQVEPEKSKALGRLQAEMKALDALRHPSILRLLQRCDPAEQEPYMVTEYHPNKTLDTHLAHYSGKALESLEAFTPLVDAVRVIHGMVPFTVTSNYETSSSPAMAGWCLAISALFSSRAPTTG
jgi:hypothetical protein